MPTFPHARHLFSAIERDYWDPEGQGARPTAAGAFVNTNVFEDSVQPLLDAGIVELVGEGYRVSESITLRLGPGHTPGHLVMDVRSAGDSALFVGDILHHPAQVYCPDWNSPFCEDQPEARLTRRRVLEDAVDRNALGRSGALRRRPLLPCASPRRCVRTHFRDTMNATAPLEAGYRFDPADPGLIRHPYGPYYEYLRSTPRLHKAATEYYVAARYADVREVIC